MRKLEKKISKKLQKSVSDVIHKIKSQTSSRRISKIVNGCRRPKSLPLYANSHRLRRKNSKNSKNSNQSDLTESEPGVNGEKKAATLEDIDRFLIENFRSLYLKKCESDHDEEESSYDTSERAFETPDLSPGDLDLSDSRRFFFNSPKTEEICSTVTSSSEDCIAVLKASGNLQSDFRRSMGDVMEARVRHGEKVDWEFMEELLFCYLKLNEKKHYRFVLDAFVDSVLDMRRNSCDGEEEEKKKDKEDVDDSV